MLDNERSIQDVATKPGAAAVLRAAISSFDRSGYAGASVRAISADAGISVSAIYHHFGSKQDLLYEIVRNATEQADDIVDAAIRVSPGDPVETMRLLVRNFAYFYTDRQTVHRVVNENMKHLNRDLSATHMAHRRRIQKNFERVIDEGRATGDFDVVDTRIAARAIVVLCRNIADWFVAGGPMDAQTVADIYSETALRILGHQSRASADSA